MTKNGITERPDYYYPVSFIPFLRFSRGEINAKDYARERRITFTVIVRESKDLIESEIQGEGLIAKPAT